VSRLALALLVLLLLLSWPSDAPAESVAELTKKLKSDDFRVRTQAALALGASDSKSAIVPLCAALSDKKDTVRAATAAALARLQKGGKSCLKGRLAKEKSKNVRKMIAKALKLIDEAAMGPSLTRSTKYYLAVGKIKDATGRGGSSIAALVRKAFVDTAGSLGGFAFAPAGETEALARKRLRKYPEVYGYRFDTTVRKQFGGGKLAMRLDVDIFAYPESERVGNLSRTVGMSGMTKADKNKENELLEKASRVAMQEFGRMAASVD
jgi:hypothetical protein